VRRLHVPGPACRPPHVDDAPVEVHVIPGQLAQLAGPEAERDGQHKQCFEPAARFGVIVQAEFRPAEMAGGPGQIGADLSDGSLEARPCAARQLASLGGRMGRRVLTRLTSPP